MNKFKNNEINGKSKNREKKSGQKTINFQRLGLPLRKVQSELLFNNGNYIYISLIIGTSWKVIRYDRSDVNIENEATISNNPGVLFQPNSLSQVQVLTY